MKRHIIAITLLLVTLSAQAQEAQPDATYRLLRHAYKVNPDGTVDYNFRKELTILRNRALTGYADKGETFIVFNPAFETLTINESYTLRKDGSRVYTPKNAFVEQLPSACADCARYNGLREMVVVHTGMEYDCTIVLDYTIHRKSGKVYDDMLLSEDCPIERYEVVLDQPKKGALRWDVHVPDGSQVALDMRSNADSTLVTLSASRLPQGLADPYLPDAHSLYPSIIVSSGHPDGFAVFDNTEKAIAAKDMLALLLENDPVEYAYSIANYVVSHVATNAIEPAALDYAVSPAAVTWGSDCGTPADKTQLLAAMLRQAGFKARAAMEQGIPVAHVTIKGMDYPLSATSKNAPAIATASSPHADIIAWEGKELGAGYSQATLPQDDMGYNASFLLASRQAPLWIRAHRADNSQTLALPQGARLVTAPYERRRESRRKLADGRPLWSMETSLRQEGDKVVVTRKFAINEDCAISGGDYADFRSALVEWQGSRQLTIKK